MLLHNNTLTHTYMHSKKKTYWLQHKYLKHKLQKHAKILTTITCIGSVIV